MNEIISDIKYISRELNIPQDRLEYIMSYIMQMIEDYNGSVIDIIKEIPLNLKDKERYFAMFTVGNSFALSFYIMKEEDKEDFMTNIINVTKLNKERTDRIADYMMNKILKDFDKNTPIDMIKIITNETFTDSEKDYILFTLGLVLIKT